MKTITICSSASFYRQVLEIEEQLKKIGFGVEVPITAKKMQENGDFEVTNYKTWFANPDDYHRKTHLMELHFQKLSRATQF